MPKRGRGSFDRAFSKDTAGVEELIQSLGPALSALDETSRGPHVPRSLIEAFARGHLRDSAGAEKVEILEQYLPHHFLSCEDCRRLYTQSRRTGPKE